MSRSNCILCRASAPLKCVAHTHEEAVVHARLNDILGLSQDIENEQARLVEEDRLLIQQIDDSDKPIGNHASEMLEAFRARCCEEPRVPLTERQREWCRDLLWRLEG